MKRSKLLSILLPLFGLSTCVSAQTDTPKDITTQIPDNYSILSIKNGYLNDDKLQDYLVALKRNDENLWEHQYETEAPNRPVLIFVQNKEGHFVLTKRNDHLILKINDGGQCDPFEGSEEGFVIKNHHFTVQNSVACGNHWTDFITFRYSKKLNDWVFEKQIFEEWVMNPNYKPNADALILGAHNIRRGSLSKPILFEHYVPKSD